MSLVLTLKSSGSERFAQMLVPQPLNKPAYHHASSHAENPWFMNLIVIWGPTPAQRHLYLQVGQTIDSSL